LVKLVPECVNCGSPVTDSLESEVEEQGQLKRGKYVNSVWMCNECAEREEKEKSSPYFTSNNKRSSDDDQSDSIGVASLADVSLILQRLMKPISNIHSFFFLIINRIHRLIGHRQITRQGIS
jgi:hypothetical protein